MAKAKKTAPVYVGPAYSKGIRLAGSDHDIRPADFRPSEIWAFLNKHPERAHWWIKEEQAKPVK